MTVVSPVVGRDRARRSCSGRRLPFHARRSTIDAGPRRRARRPDGHRRLGQLRIVERADANEDQVRSNLGLAEQWGAAARAEPAVHPVAAVRNTRVVDRRPGDREGRCAKAGADGSAASTQVLAIAAPAHPRRDRRFGALPPNRTAKATPCHGHLALRGRRGAAREIVLRDASPTAPPDRSGARLCSGKERTSCPSVEPPRRSNVGSGKAVSQ
jgi:hypothetical protein